MPLEFVEGAVNRPELPFGTTENVARYYLIGVKDQFPRLADAGWLCCMYDLDELGKAASLPVSSGEIN